MPCCQRLARLCRSVLFSVASLRYIEVLPAIFALKRVVLFGTSYGANKKRLPTILRKSVPGIGESPRAPFKKSLTICAKSRINHPARPALDVPTSKHIAIRASNKNSIHLIQEIPAFKMKSSSLFSSVGFLALFFALRMAVQFHTLWIRS